MCILVHNSLDLSSYNAEPVLVGNFPHQILVVDALLRVPVGPSDPVRSLGRRKKRRGLFPNVPVLFWWFQNKKDIHPFVGSPQKMRNLISQKVWH